MIARIALVTAALLASSAFAAPLKVDTAKSGVGVTFKQMGVAVDAKFNGRLCHL
jgi:polyisoprenoid-binding protein YceI